MKGLCNLLISIIDEERRGMLALPTTHEGKGKGGVAHPRSLSLLFLHLPLVELHCLHQKKSSGKELNFGGFHGNITFCLAVRASLHAVLYISIVCLSSNFSLFISAFTSSYVFQEAPEWNEQLTGCGCHIFLMTRCITSERE
ncbi:hypothetical protein C4D60_Mb04t27860 [Musa balbisiana]|uniref:Uncharacterized protein n=1 Tax=Musa balbisiana TaxID=52838 RepID=A0A4S8KFB0_MUSBA|nr:hypothetical protein C4D60_Mb04t27860 [Musa balbisiana]